jgi:hypothetical protein
METIHFCQWAGDRNKSIVIIFYLSLSSIFFMLVIYLINKISSEIMRENKNYIDDLPLIPFYKATKSNNQWGDVDPDNPQKECRMPSFMAENGYVFTDFHRYFHDSVRTKSYPDENTPFLMCVPFQDGLITLQDLWSDPHMKGFSNSLPTKLPADRHYVLLVQRNNPKKVIGLAELTFQEYVENNTYFLHVDLLDIFISKEFSSPTHNGNIGRSFGDLLGCVIATRRPLNSDFPESVSFDKAIVSVNSSYIFDKECTIDTSDGYEAFAYAIRTNFLLENGDGQDVPIEFDVRFIYEHDDIDD